MKKALTLYELNEIVSDTLQTVMPNEYWVEAELSEAREVRGHCYMELVQKDEQNNTPIAKASAKCWRNKWIFIRPYFERVTGQQLRSGMKVMLKVYANFHIAYGFSWIVTDINPEYTMGDMARKRQEIIAQLKDEGVFDLQKELYLSSFAQRIAVISSAQAAGFGDFNRQLLDNGMGYHFDIKLFPTVMQGEQVEQSVINALNQVNTQIDSFDAVVIIRGGGATSDLSSFDTLLLAENVANFPLPIITGIGHDRDESVLDMISFQRVKTPTAAAAFLIDNLNITWQHIVDAQEEIMNIATHRMDNEKMRLQTLASKIPLLFSQVKERQLYLLQQCFLRISTEVSQRIASQKTRIQVLSAHLYPVALQKVLKEQHNLEILQQRCSSLNPQIILARGYSITLHNGHAVHDIATLKSGDEIKTKVEKGNIISTVK